MPNDSKAVAALAEQIVNFVANAVMCPEHGYSGSSAHLVAEVRALLGASLEAPPALTDAQAWELWEQLGGRDASGFANKGELADWVRAVVGLYVRGEAPPEPQNVRAWIAALPTDALAGVANAYGEAYDAQKEAGASWPTMYGAGAAAARDALLSLVRGEAGSLPPTYEQGYENGESSQLADWQFALTEWCELPDDVEIAPTAVAHYIASLQGRGVVPAPPPEPWPESRCMECGGGWGAKGEHFPFDANCCRENRHAKLQPPVRGEAGPRPSTPEQGYLLFLDGDKYYWKQPTITGADLRVLGGIPQTVAIYLKVADKPDEPILDQTVTAVLDRCGFARFSTQARDSTSSGEAGPLPPEPTDEEIAPVFDRLNSEWTDSGGMMWQPWSEVVKPDVETGQDSPLGHLVRGIAKHFAVRGVVPAPPPRENDD